MGRKITRLYTGPDGESHFQDIEIPMAGQKKGKGLRSEPMKATSVIFSETAGDYYIDWHNASHRQLLITLTGKNEIEVGDGTRRRFGPGDILLAEDTTGHGHISRGLSDDTRQTVFITLD